VSAYRFIAAERANYPVALMCRVLHVSRSGFYDWCRRPPSRRAIQAGELTKAIRVIHGGSRGTYGAPRIAAELRAHGVRISTKRVARLMRVARLQGRHLRRRPRRPSSPPAAVPDLVAQSFRAPGPDRIWAADITYLPTDQGWMHLAVVLDLYSRRVVGWSIGPHLRTDLVLGALQMAIARRSPHPGLVHHSDRGSQYTSEEFTSRLGAFGIAPSVGARASALDNAAVESFFATMKREISPAPRFLTRSHARATVAEWIEVFYNCRRRHSTLGYLSPVEFERLSTAGVSA
jgi:putative transposase